MLLKSKTYDFLKELTLVYLPALGTLYFALCTIWGLPYGEQVVGTIAAICTCLGTCLHISTKKYNDFVKLQNKEEPADSYILEKEGVTDEE